MSRERFIPKPSYDTPIVPFETAEDAWFWFIRCQRLRRAGARLSDGPGDTARPCDPDDIYRAVRELAVRRCLRPEHLDVLARFGVRESPPDTRCREESRAARLWAESLDSLASVLKSKAIVA